MSSLEKLCQIPIYRLLLLPESYLPENNIGISYFDLVIQLPNHDNKNHKQVLKNKPIDYHKIYYNSTLLIETKVFCDNILRFSGLYDDSFDEILSKNDLNSLFKIFFNNQSLFLKTLIKNDILKFNLVTGRVLIQIKSSKDINEIFSILRGFGLIDKIIQKSIDEIKLLY